MKAFRRFTYCNAVLFFIVFTCENKSHLWHLMRVFKIEPSELIHLRADPYLLDVCRFLISGQDDARALQSCLWSVWDTGWTDKTMPPVWNLSVSGTDGILAGVKGRIFGLVLFSAARVLALVPGLAMSCLCKRAPAWTYTIGVKI